MLMLLLLLAGPAATPTAAPPRPVPTRKIIIPAAWRDVEPPPPPTATPTAITGQTKTLADIARERRGKAKPAGAFAAADSSVTTPDAERVAKQQEKDIDEASKNAKAKADSSYWTARINSAQAEVESAEREVAEAEATVVIGGNAQAHATTTAAVMARVDAAKARLQTARRLLDEVLSEAHKDGAGVSSRPKD